MFFIYLSYIKFFKMGVLTIQLENEHLVLLEQKAKALNLTVEQYVAQYLKKLTQSREERLEEITSHILTKNAELYRRLA